jgi:hypothetical protein
MKILKFTLFLLLPFVFSSCNNDDEIASSSSTQLKLTKNSESLLGGTPTGLYMRWLMQKINMKHIVH